MSKNKFTKYSKNCSDGFTLLGTLFSAFIAILVITSIASISAQVYSSSRNSRDRFIAVGLAKEGIELVRNIRDGNWFYYPGQPWDLVPVTRMKWRGKGDGSSCSTGTSCLRDLCNGSFTVDALDPNLALSPSFVRPFDTKLKNDNDGYYTYNSTNQDTIFSRKITIGSSGVCGEEANGDISGAPLVLPVPPNPIKVISSVSWKDSKGVDHQVNLQESLYDWIMQRP